MLALVSASHSQSREEGGGKTHRVLFLLASSSSSVMSRQACIFFQLLAPPFWLVVFLMLVLLLNESHEGSSVLLICQRMLASALMLDCAPSFVSHDSVERGSSSVWKDKKTHDAVRFARILVGRRLVDTHLHLLHYPDAVLRKEVSISARSQESDRGSAPKLRP
jgi:hypothetical protein